MNSFELELFAKRIRAIRLFRELTQREVAARAGVSLSFYAKFERDGVISTPKLLNILMALGIDGEFRNFISDPGPVYKSLDHFERAHREVKRIRKPRKRATT